MDAPKQERAAAPTPPIDADFELAPSPAPARARHGPPVALRLLLLLTLIGAGVWWYLNSGGVLPWTQVEGPLTASGTLESDEVLVAFEIAGRLVELVDEGAEVPADAVVARLDDSLVQTQIRQASVAQMQQLQIQAERYQLRAPMAGVVTRVALHVGEVVSPGTTVLAVADLERLELTAYVLERDLGAVQVGQEVVVTADPFPDRAFRGVVISTNPRAEFTPRNIQTREDRLNLVFGVNIRVENPDRALKPGMPVDVSFAPAATPVSAP